MEQMCTRSIEIKNELLEALSKEVRSPSLFPNTATINSQPSSGSLPLAPTCVLMPTSCFQNMELQAQSERQQREIQTLRSQELDVGAREELEKKDKEIARLTAQLLAADRSKLSRHRRCASNYSEKSWSDTWSEVDEVDCVLDSPHCPQQVREVPCKADPEVATQDPHAEVASSNDDDGDNTHIEERMEIPREFENVLPG